MIRHRVRQLAKLSILLVLPVLTCGASPALQDLLQRVSALEARTGDADLAIQGLVDDVVALEAGTSDTTAAIQALSQQVTDLEAEMDGITSLVERALGVGPRTVLLDDDFEDGIDPAWVQVNGTTLTIAPTGDCTQAYFSKYANCGSLGLHFDEVERYDYELPVPSTGSFSLYFHDDPADTAAAAFIAMRQPGTQERLGVATGHCPNHYFLSLSPGTQHHCTNIPRRVGWHRIEFVRNGTTTKGYLDHVLVFETNHPDRNAFGVIMVVQEISYLLLDGFAIDDVRFEAFD